MPAEACGHCTKRASRMAGPPPSHCVIPPRRQVMPHSQSRYTLPDRCLPPILRRQHNPTPKASSWAETRPKAVDCRPPLTYRGGNGRPQHLARPSATVVEPWQSGAGAGASATSRTSLATLPARGRPGASVRPPVLHSGASPAVPAAGHSGNTRGEKSMNLRRLCAGLVVSAAVLATGCACCHRNSCPAPVVSSAPPCCAPAAPAPCCPGGPTVAAPVQSFAPPYAPGVIH
jgi:hypothetical protein